MNTPFITLIVPTHMRPALLKRALNSINSQKFREEIEVIVVSDVDDYQTLMVCKENLTKEDIYIRRNGLNGPSASRNIGLQLANGKNIMFLDDDDTWHCDFYDNLRKINFNLYFNYFNCNVIKEQRFDLEQKKLNEFSLNLKDKLDINVFVKNQVHMSCLIFNAALLKNKEFDCSMRAYEDWDFLLNIYKEIFPIHLPITCANVYEVDDQTTDRRGSSADALNFNAVLDYLYVYRRYPAPNGLIREKRQKMLASAGLLLPVDLL